MKTVFRLLGLLLLVLALASVAVLWGTDAVNQLESSKAHTSASAMAMMLIGLSYVSCQFIREQAPKKTLKSVLLGLAFFLWGFEQFLPQSRIVTLLDTVIISIFVVDLGLLSLDRLRTAREEERRKIRIEDGEETV